MATWCESNDEHSTKCGNMKDPNEQVQQSPASHRPKTLIVTYYFPPMSDIAVQRPFFFARDLAKFGYDPIVLTADSDDFTNSEMLNQLVGVAEVSRVSRWFCRPFGFSLFALFRALQIARRQPFDIIIGTAPHWSALKTALLVSLFTRRPLVVDVRDPWTYGFLWNPKNVIDGALERFWEKRVLARASKIVYLHAKSSENMRERVSPSIAAKIVTITHGFDETPVDPQRQEEDKFTMCHMGKLHPAFRDPAILFQAMKLACKNKEFSRDAKLNLYGNVGEYESNTLSPDIEKQVVFAGTVSTDESRAIMRGSDVLVLMNLLSGEADELQPAKTYEYLASRRPVLGIVSERGVSSELLRKTGTAEIVGIDDPQQIANGMLRLWKKWQAGALDNHQLDLAGYSRQDKSREMALLIDDVLNLDVVPNT